MAEVPRQPYRLSLSFFSVQPLCSLCLRGEHLSKITQPQRHREHRGCTEKSKQDDFVNRCIDIRLIPGVECRRFLVTNLAFARVLATPRVELEANR